MKLADEQQNPPPHDALAQSLSQAPGKHDEGGGVGEAQQPADDKLGVREADEVDEGPAEAGEQHGADKCAGHRAGEFEVVVGGPKTGGNVVGGRAVDEDVVGGLDVEGFLYFCVRGQDEVEGDEGWDEAQESVI